MQYICVTTSNNSARVDKFSPIAAIINILYFSRAFLFYLCARQVTFVEETEILCTSHARVSYSTLLDKFCNSRDYTVLPFHLSRLRFSMLESVLIMLDFLRFHYVRQLRTLGKIARVASRNYYKVNKFCKDIMLE